ncbi:hypothetical protein BSIN_0325 [Burkholderia singularis]|uniref:Uncharacterized protein n=1 Tax=Burkholderia singularis TaxID=1503053 RepID=A0A238H4Q4_9BURK|nr:hypothetical protein BSIN_0325 [Burkholderia singularis]
MRRLRRMTSPPEIGARGRHDEAWRRSRHRAAPADGSLKFSRGGP